MELNVILVVIPPATKLSFALCINSNMKLVRLFKTQYILNSQILFVEYLKV